MSQTIDLGSVTTYASALDGGYTGTVAEYETAIENLADKSEYQFNTMPTASATYVGKIVQYIGQTTSNYTHGYFYECKENSGTYSWVFVPIGDLPSGGHTIVNSSGTSMANESDLQFVGAIVSDDNKTIVDMSLTTLPINPTSAQINGYPDGTMWIVGPENKEISTLPYPFYQGSAVIYNNEIYILGTFDSNNQTKHYKWNGTTWTSVSTLPYSFDDGSAVVYNNEIHILGGSRSGNRTKHYKWNGTTWTEVSTLPYDFYDGCAVVYNSEIHILGNGDGRYRTNHYKWNGTSWTLASTLPDVFFDGSAVVYNNEIHILGGYADETRHYKWDGISWSSVSILSHDFSNGCAVVYNNEIHILGGGSNRYDHYKWNGTSWLEVSTLPYRVWRSSAVVFSDEINILGGYFDTTKHYQIIA